MLKRVLVSTMILLVMYLVVFLAFWMIMPLNSSGDLIAILMLLSVSLVCALVVAAGASFALWWVSLLFFSVGILCTFLGILLFIIEPEGIITPFILALGGGLFLGGFTVLVGQLWWQRKRNRTSEIALNKH